MALVTTLPELYRPLMDAPSVRPGRCAVCGRTAPLNDHRLVGPSLGMLVRDGRAVESPVVTLCGAGNVLYCVDGGGGRFATCNGKAHHRMIHFRVEGGRLEYVELASPARYEEALSMGGWRPLDPAAALAGPAPRAPKVAIGWARGADGRDLPPEEARRRLLELLGE